MWYVAQTACGKERTAIEECRNALPENLAARIFVPRYQYMKKYQGQWHSEEAAAFPGYVFIESEKPVELEEALLRIPHTITPVRIGGGFYPIRVEEETFLRKMLHEQDWPADGMAGALKARGRAGAEDRPSQAPSRSGSKAL